MKDHKLAFIRNLDQYNCFKRRLGQLEKVTAPFAKAIKCLESGHSTVSNVFFLFNLSIVATLRQLFDNNESELALPEDVVESIRSISKSRYYNMVLASGNKVYCAGFFLHPLYRDTDILQCNNLNPLATGTLVLRPMTSSSSSNTQDLSQTFPLFIKVALYLKKLLCYELNAGTIPAAKEYPSTPEGVADIINVFKLQLAAYTPGEFPFIIPSPIPPNFSPYNFWGKLSKHPDGCFLAHIARKLFALVANSMAEERTVSCFTTLNTKERSWQKDSTLARMTRIRQHLIRKRRSPQQAHKPVLQYCDLSDSVLKKHSPIATSTPTAEADLPDGWLVNDVETETIDDTNCVGTNDECEAENASDEEYEDIPDPIAPEVVNMGNNDTDFYGIDTTNQVLLDMLADSPAGHQMTSGVTQKRPEASASQKSVVSAKKDTSTVDLGSY